MPARRLRWSKQLVIAAILQRHQKGLSLTHVWKYDPRLYSAARHHWGSWREALAAA